MANLTPRENFVRFLTRQPVEWMPTSDDQLSFLPELIPDNVARGMVAQQTPHAGEWGGPDWFGVQWRFDPRAGGSMEIAPLLEDIEDWEERVTFPALSQLDWAGCAEANRDYLNTDKLKRTTIFTGFFERLISFVGFEDAAIALIDESQRETVLRLFDRLADFYIEEIRYMHRYFGVEWVELHDDWGAQHSTLFSVDTHAACIVPYVRKVVEGAHAEGVFVEMHSCGMIEPLIPNLIRTGVDTWRGQNINDKWKLVEQYGDRFLFGVELRPDAAVSDGEALQLARACRERYEGKRVWISLGRSFTPSQRAMVLTELHRK